MKIGLGDSYDDVQFVPVKLRAYLDITKPASTVGVAGGFFIASVLYYYLQGNPQGVAVNFTDLVFSCATIAFAHGASQALNMAEDAEMDKEAEHKQNRPIPSGAITEDEARSITWLLAGAALVRGYLVNVTFGVFVTILLLFGVFYNLRPVRAKSRVWSIPWQAASRGLLLIPAVWAAHGSIFEPLPWAFGAFMFLYVAGFQNSADIIDEEVDRKHGVETFVVRYGLDGVVKIASGCMFLMIGLVLLMWELSIFPGSMLSLLLIIPFCVAMLYHMRYHPHKVSSFSGNHPSWTWFYGGMMVAIGLPLLAEVMM